MILKKMNQIRDELENLSNYEVVLFGSYTEGSMGSTSDYDVAVITRSTDTEDLHKLHIQIAAIISPPYEVHLFETLPIHIQISVIRNYKVVFGNPLEISEYFYGYRKKWEDCKYRILSNQITNHEERERLRKVGDKIIAKFSAESVS